LYTYISYAYIKANVINKQAEKNKVANRN